MLSADWVLTFYLDFVESFENSIRLQILKNDLLKSLFIHYSAVHYRQCAATLKIGIIECIWSLAVPAKKAINITCWKSWCRSEQKSCPQHLIEDNLSRIVAFHETKRWNDRHGIHSNQSTARHIFTKTDLNRIMSSQSQQFSPSIYNLPFIHNALSVLTALFLLNPFGTNHDSP